MNAIRVHKQIDSDTLHIPELEPLIGKSVEIIILEEMPPELPAEERLKPFFDLAGQDVVDPEAYKQLRAASMI